MKNLLVLAPLGAPPSGDTDPAQAHDKLQEEVDVWAAWANFQAVALVLGGLFDIILFRYPTLPNEE